MNKLMIVILGAAVLVGCRTAEVTPEGSWANYRCYYSSTGKVAKPVGDAMAECRVVESKAVDANVEELKKQGKVVLGTFAIADGSDITYETVQALAKKLNASAVVWSTVNDASAFCAGMPNGDPAIPGIDYTKAIQMSSTRPDQTFADHTVRTHTIYMMGCE